jgi:hypothetical protein
MAEMGTVDVSMFLVARMKKYMDKLVCIYDQLQIHAEHMQGRHLKMKAKITRRDLHIKYLQTRNFKLGLKNRALKIALGISQQHQLKVVLPIVPATPPSTVPATPEAVPATPPSTVVYPERRRIRRVIHDSD